MQRLYCFFPCALIRSFVAARDGAHDGLVLLNSIEELRNKANMPNIAITFTSLIKTTFYSIANKVARLVILDF